jgi:hypothetical protein
MGLDTYAAPKFSDEETLPAVQQKIEQDFAGCLGLMGGMFSGGGNSFRGKVYNGLVESITGESLYQDRINNVVVCRMAILISYAAKAKVPHEASDLWDASQDLKPLAEWFTIAADNGYDVVGWW